VAGHEDRPADRRRPVPSHRGVTMKSARLTTALAAAGVLTLVVLALPAISMAANSGTGDYSAGDQYVETLPGAGGSKPAGAGHGTANGSLPPSVLAAIAKQGGPLGTALTQVAQSARYGNPQRHLTGVKPVSSSSTPSAAVK